MMGDDLEITRPLLALRRSGKALVVFLDFHPMLQSLGLKGVFARLVHKYNYLFPCLIGSPIFPRLAWRNGGESLFELTRGAYRTKRPKVTVRE